MVFVPKELTGRLFDNRAERRNKRQPDYTGTVTVHGKVFRISGWYNPPSERSKVATIGLNLEDYDEYKRRGAAQTASDDPSAEAPARTPPTDRRPAADPTEPLTFRDLSDDDIPF